jgi:hypothetical protein
MHIVSDKKNGYTKHKFNITPVFGTNKQQAGPGHDT